MIELETGVTPATIGVFDIWGRKLFGGFESKDEAALWLLNNMPWKLIQWNVNLGMHTEVTRVPTEFEADLYIRYDPTLKKVQCEAKEYVCCIDLRPYTNQIH
jgi:hypothetical protein